MKDKEWKETLDKIKSWSLCSPDCIHRRTMIDVSDKDYKISFCDKYMEAILKGTHCYFYNSKVEVKE